MLIFPMMVTYDMKFGQLVRNCAIMVVARLPWSLLWLAVTALLPFILVMYIPYGIPIVAVLYLVIGFGLTGLYLRFLCQRLFRSVPQSAH